MKPTGYLQEATKEIQALESRRQTLELEIAGLEARKKLASERERSQRIDLQATETRLESAKGALQESKSEAQRILDQANDTAKSLSEEAAVRLAVDRLSFETEVANRSRDLDRMQETRIKESKDLIFRFSELEKREKEAQSKELELKDREESLLEAIRRHAEESEASEKALKDRFRNLGLRDSSLTALDSRLTALKEELSEREATVRKQEEILLISRQEKEEAQKRAIAVSEAYERRIASLEAKEKALRIREIRLADREGVAQSHGAV